MAPEDVERIVERRSDIAFVHVLRTADATRLPGWPGAR
jgi:hypothetical protein